MDNYGTHKKESVLTILNKFNTVVKFIPTNTTNYLQPLDVAVKLDLKTGCQMVKRDLHPKVTVKNQTGKRY